MLLLVFIECWLERETETLAPPAFWLIRASVPSQWHVGTAEALCPHSEAFIQCKRVMRITSTDSGPYLQTFSFVLSSVVPLVTLENLVSRLEKPVTTLS